MMTFNDPQVVDGIASQDNNHSVKQLNINEEPLVIFTPCSNSHAFEERRISVSQNEEQPTKIGRAVLRSQPSSTNAIFDCKVLSRNHAAMWYKDKKFYIKDTRSSNGTFLNNERLSNCSEVSAPHVLHSGDILQFGIEIIDNTKRVASGCITCIVSLINEYGKECLSPAIALNESLPFSNRLNKMGLILNNSSSIEKLFLENETFSLKYTLISNDKIFIMNQYLKEARFCENLLGQKLMLLEKQLTTSQEALQASWQALIKEEHLLSRIELLESQLSLYITNTKNNNREKIKKDAEVNSSLSNNINVREEEIRVEIQEIHEDCVKSEIAAKDELRKTEEQMFETNMRLHNAKNGLLNLEEENSFLRQKCQDLESELSFCRVEMDELICDLGKQNAESIELKNKLEKNQTDYNSINNELKIRQNEYDTLFNNFKLLEKKHLNELKKNQINKKRENKKEQISDNKNNNCSILIPSQSLNDKKNKNVNTNNFNSLIVNNENTNATKQVTKVYPNKKILNENNNNLLTKIDENENIKIIDEKNVPNVLFNTENNGDQINKTCCNCNQNLLNNDTDKRERSALSIQVLLFSTLPLTIAFFTLLLPLFKFLSSKILTKKNGRPVDAIVCESPFFEKKKIYKSESPSEIKNEPKCKNT